MTALELPYAFLGFDSDRIPRHRYLADDRLQPFRRFDAESLRAVAVKLGYVVPVERLQVELIAVEFEASLVHHLELALEPLAGGGLNPIELVGGRQGRLPGLADFGRVGSLSQNENLWILAEIEVRARDPEDVADGEAQAARFDGIRPSPCQHQNQSDNDRCGQSGHCSAGILLKTAHGSCSFY